MKNLLPSMLAIAGFVLFACSDNKPDEHHSGLAGKWTITGVTLDGTIASGWEGKSITFAEVTLDSGVYDFPDTPYDSIMSPTGTWVIRNAVSFDLEDHTSVVYAVTGKNLTMTFIRNVRHQDCPSPPEPCILTVAGTLMFNLKK